MLTKAVKNSCKIIGFYTTKCHSFSQLASPKICIVGSGPAGFYTAQNLIKNDASIEIDMYEKLPVPFGLVRYGVAPDHPDVKNVINTFTSTAKSEKFQFVGNVAVGTDVSLSQLRSAYHIVVLAYGAAQDRWLGVTGENLDNIVPARKFVGWYNGLPEEKNLEPDLDVETAVIIGQGNVALDVARILLSPVDILKKTDIAQHALEALKKSSIQKVLIVGRRGPLQVAFTIKELREMTRLPNVSHKLHLKDYEEYLKTCLSSISRPKRRITELMLKSYNENLNSDSAKQWELLFNRSPLKFLHNEDGNKVAGILFGVNRLEGEDIENPLVIDTGVTETIKCGLVVKSIGYKSLPLSDELPFDHAKGVIHQEQGRVVGMADVYCCGWVASGPVGVIASTIQSGQDVAKSILEDLQGRYNSLSKNKQGLATILPLLKSKGVKPVTFVEWEALDREERLRGKHYEKPREKIVDVAEMINIAKKDK